MSNITPAVPDPPEIENLLWSGFSQAHVGYDIGANCGQSFHHMRTFVKNIVAYEPSFEAVDWMKENLAPRNEIIRCIAVSDHVGSVDLYAMPGKIDSGQLVSAVANMEWDAPSPTFARSVPTTTIDTEVFDTYSNLTPPGFIKIDVEGHEEQIIRGATRTIREVQPEFLIEIHDSQQGHSIKTSLEYFGGYQVTPIRHPHYSFDSVLYWNHYWIKAIPS